MSYGITLTMSRPGSSGARPSNTATSPSTATDVQINHLPLHRPSFQQLLAPPKAFPLVRLAMHAKYGEEPTFLDMADGFVCHDNHGQTWHQDGEYVRLTFAIDDIEEGFGGGTGFMPGTHRAAELAGPATPLAQWANIEAEKTDSGIAGQLDFVFENDEFCISNDEFCSRCEPRGRLLCCAFCVQNDKDDRDCRTNMTVLYQ